MYCGRGDGSGPSATEDILEHPDFAATHPGGESKALAVGMRTQFPEALEGHRQLLRRAPGDGDAPELSFPGKEQPGSIAGPGDRIDAARAPGLAVYLARLSGDFDRFRADFDLVGKHLTNVKTKYDEADKRLIKFGDRLQGLSGAEAALVEETKKLPL